MEVSGKDRAILRRLAGRVAEIAALPVHREKTAEWRRLNGLRKGRPLVWINEVPWHEMDVDGELELQSSDAFCRQTEQTLRRTIYQWEHMPGDAVVEARFHAPLALHDTGFGIEEEARIIRQDERGGIVSREFHPQIREEKDLEKIRTPVITHHAEASERTYETLADLFGDLLVVEMCGIVHRWFAPWDELVRWWGVQEALTDLALRPELVHRAMDRLVRAYLARLDQWEALNVLSVTEGNYRVGSGGLGYTDELPRPDFDPQRVRSSDQWGCATAQIFSEVSPEMHEAFALRYERRWLERFGLNYYGCCEPLHLKLDVLKRVPNLRKVSMSPWADLEQAAEKAGDRYVLSHKPNPAVFAVDPWNPGQARRDLREALEKTRGCVVEVIMKDISTVRNEPQRLWAWERIAMEEVGRF
ncbi:MAG: hypothetical protein EXS64_02230 [Candidatus Latescibacteria bacterium]|nr:hypothetical protein [Candidatus Latescibacterota bacterium]